MAGIHVQQPKPHADRHKFRQDVYYVDLEFIQTRGLSAREAFFVERQEAGASVDSSTPGEARRRRRHAESFLRPTQYIIRSLEQMERRRERAKGGG